MIARRLRVSSASSGVELAASVCSKLRRQHGLIVTPLPGSSGDLIALQRTSIASLEVAGEVWQATISDGGEVELDPGRSKDVQLLAVLVERGLVVAFESMRVYFNLSNSTRYWCRNTPVRTVGGIEMVPRVSFATLPIAGEGVGIALDFSHLFRTQRSLDYYFAAGLNDKERRSRAAEFDRLRGRGDRRKGTLLYDSGSRTMSVCYFAHDGQGRTCRDSGPLAFAGERYMSLYDYYAKKRPKLGVRPEDPLVYVSFRGMRGDKPVAAKLLRLRVMLDPQRMPRELRANTTIEPLRRRELTQKMWEKIPQSWLTDAELTASDSLWTPDDSVRELLAPPTLVFGRGREVQAPTEASQRAYGKYFKDRRQTLMDGGVYSYDEGAGRELIVVTPPESPRWSSALQKAFVEDLVNQVSGLAGRNLRAVVIRGEKTDDIAEQLSTTALLWLKFQSGSIRCFI